MSLTLTADVELALTAMNRAIAHIENKAPVVNEMAAYAMETVLDNFSGQHDPDGKPWEALSPSSLVRKGHSGTLGNGILVDSGKMIGSFKMDKSAYGFSLDNTTPYAPIHQHGFAAANIPARPFMGFGKADEAWLHAIMTAWLTRGLS